MTDWKAETDSYRKAQWYLVFVAMGVYLAFLIQVHLFPDPRAASQLSKQYHQSERMAMDRGSIYDSNGEFQESFSTGVEPHKIEFSYGTQKVELQ